MSIIDNALAEATANTAPGLGTTLAGFIPLILIFIVFYFLIIRPQQKKIKEHNRLLDSIKKGDKVVINNGIIATVNKVDNSNSLFYLEISSGVEVKALKTSISDVLNKQNKITPSTEEK